MKKFISLLIAFSIITCSAMFVHASENSIGSESTYSTESADMSHDEIMNTFKIAAAKNANKVDTASIYAVSVSYTVNAVCDTEWLTVMSASGLGGLDDAEFIIDEISDGFETWAGIKLRGYAINATTLNETSTDPLDHLDEAIDEYGLGSRELMIAFSGYEGSYVSAGGYAYIGEPTCILFLQSYDDMWMVGRHETGHMFGVYQGTQANDYDCSKECVMNDYCYSYYDIMCSDCLAILQNNKNIHK